MGRGPCHQSGCTRQAGSELECAAGSGRACGRGQKGKREEMPLVSAGPWASLLSRIRDAKNSSKEKTRKPCNVTSETSQCKLLTLNAERPEGKVRSRGLQKASLSPTPANVYVAGIITGWANYRARPPSRMHLSKPQPSPGLTKAFSGMLGRMLSLTKWKLGLYFLKRLGLGRHLEKLGTGF